MKRQYLIVLLAAVVLDILIFISSKTALFPNVIQGGFLSPVISRIIWCVAFDILLLFFGIKAQAIFDLPYEVIVNKRVTFNLAKNDFKVKYVGSYLGIFWAFINPLVTIVLYWIVFQFAFHNGDVDGHPFVLWLIAGMIPWFFIQDALTNGTMALIEYSYLVKKVLFKISILPAVKVFSAYLIHAAFMVILFITYIALGHFPNLYWLQLIYYSGCSIVMTMALAYATSAIQLFVRDLSQFVGVILQILMWATPIMWNPAIVPAGKMWIFKLNPAYYIITGYRDSLLYHINAFARIGNMLYFWCFVIILLVVSSSLFKKLQPHFADVL